MYGTPPVEGRCLSLSINLKKHVLASPLRGGGPKGRKGELHEPDNFALKKVRCIGQRVQFTPPPCFAPAPPLNGEATRFFRSANFFDSLRPRAEAEMLPPAVCFYFLPLCCFAAKTHV